MHILVVDDDESTRKGIVFFLENEAFEVTAAGNGKEALERAESYSYDLILTDVKMPEMSGLELLQKMQEKPVRPPIMIMTAFATVADAVKALQNGAEDYLTKPLNLDELLLKINRLSDRMRLRKENKQLKNRLKQYEFPEIIGNSDAMQAVQDSISQVCKNPDVPVMIIGESGTGKEIVARTIHGKSQRAERNFIAINCAALNDELLESELFGYKKGAFTGAYRDKDGIFHAADGGTLLLDEVSEMSLRMQAKLLRVLQEQIIQPVGSTVSTKIDLRVLGASNKDLQALVKDGAFREDLYYRLNVVEIAVPPLRERKEDIPILLHHFVQKYSIQRQQPLHFSQEVVTHLQDYQWPGNVRELENLVRNVVVTCEGEEVTLIDLPDKFHEGRTRSHQVWESFAEEHDYKKALAAATSEFEKSFLSHYLRLNQGNISKTARMIGLSRVALHQKIKQYDLVLNQD